MRSSLFVGLLAALALLTLPVFAAEEPNDHDRPDIRGYIDDEIQLLLRDKITDTVEKEFTFNTDLYDPTSTDRSYYDTREMKFNDNKVIGTITLVYWDNTLMQIAIYVPKEERIFYDLVNDYSAQYGKGAWDSDDYIMFADSNMDVVELTHIEGGTIITYLTSEYIEWAMEYYGESPCRGIKLVDPTLPR